MLLLISLNYSIAQTPAEQRKEADKLFDQGQYAAACNMYDGVMTNFAKDYDLNFRYGVCLLLVRKDKEAAIMRLSYAIRSATIDNRAYYYLGKAYHLNYQFNEAVQQYNKFDSKGTNSEKNDLLVDVDIKACGHGKKLLSNITDIIVLKKTEIDEDKFYNLYDETEMNGSILRYSDFQSKEDKKRDHRPLIFFPKNSPKIFYSSYGEDGSTGLDIWVKTKLPGGKYSKAQKVFGGVKEVFRHFDGNSLVRRCGL